jgi:hypothetical protein
LVNAFTLNLTTQNSDDHKNEKYSVILSRFRTVYELQKVLLTILPFMNYYRPPIVVFGLVDTSKSNENLYVHNLLKKKDAKKAQKRIVATKTKPSTSKVVKEKKKPKTTTNSDNELSDNDTASTSAVPELLDSETDLDVTISDDFASSTSTSTEFINNNDLDKISFFFREFDISILNLIHLPIEEALESDNNKSMPNIDPLLFIYFMNNTNKKLAFILKSSTGFKINIGGGEESKLTKQQLFLQLNNINAEEIARNLVRNCLNSICDRLNSIYKLIKPISNDQTIGNKHKNVKLLMCFNKLLELFKILVSWLESNRDQTRLAKQTIKCIASNYKVQSETNGEKNYLNFKKIKAI